MQFNLFLKQIRHYEDSFGVVAIIRELSINIAKKGITVYGYFTGQLPYAGGQINMRNGVP